MAGELTVTSALAANKTTASPYYSKPAGIQSFVVDQATPGGGVPGLMSAPTAGADVYITGLTALGLCEIQNLDPTNYVELGVKPAATFYPVIKLLPGEKYVFRLTTGITPHVRANTAACALSIEIYNA